MKTLFTSVTLLVITVFNTSGQTVNEIDLAGLQTEINSLEGFTKILFFGDPTCPGCIASANDLRNQIFDDCDNPDLRGLIVWIHVSGFPSTMNEAITQSNSWSDSRVSFYWDSLGTDLAYAFGYQITWSGCNYAWDISMIYLDTATWTDTYPPEPYFCMSKAGCCNNYSINNEYNHLVTAAACAAVAVPEVFSSQSGITIFPNPANDYITLNFENTKLNTQIEILNALGESLIVTENQNKIDVSNLEAGMYFLRMKQEDKFCVNKFVCFQK